MTMLSFRVDDDVAMHAEWAEALGVDRSELMSDALHRHLVRLPAENDIRAWNDQPLDNSESALAEIAD